MTHNRRNLIFSALSLPLSRNSADAEKTTVLVLCTGNSARSQMTQGFLQSLDHNLEVFSAGTNPATRVNPFAVRAMSEIGIDISHHTPNHVRLHLGQSFDFVVTVCDDADKNCPNFSGKVGKRLHIGFPNQAPGHGLGRRKTGGLSRGPRRYTRTVSELLLDPHQGAEAG